MNHPNVLLTGDYWHDDFESVVRSFTIPVTLVAMEKIPSVFDSKFDLIVVAQSRRDQFSQKQIDSITSMHVGTPIVALLGSWCEGETRSGNPWPGVRRIYWHQWAGQYELFLSQLATEGITDWHQPRTATMADQIFSFSKGTFDTSPTTNLIAISALTRQQHEMIADAVDIFGWKSCWVERSGWDRVSAQSVSVICVEANSWSERLGQRVQWLREIIPNKPIVLLLNYPRKTDSDAIFESGIAGVVSKPFKLVELRSALERAVNDVPAPKLKLLKKDVAAH